MKTKLLTSISLAFLSLSSIAQPGSLDMTFTPGGGPSARVYDSKIHTSGKPLFAGTFNEYDSWLTNQVGLILANINGTWNSSFNITAPGGIAHDIYCSAIESNGNILAGGSIYHFGGVQGSLLKRFNEFGALDNTFNPAELLNGEVRAIGVQTDGKIIYAAYYTDAINTTIPLYKFERLNTSGSIDNTFNVGTGPNDQIRSMAIQSDGKIIIGGRFTSYNGTAKNYIARVNTNGSIDNTFNIGTGFNTFAEVRNIQIQADGKIIVVGEFTTFNGTSRSGIVRLNTNGSIDTSFNPGTGASGGSTTGVYDVAIQADGKIIIVGNFFSYNGTNIKSVARINTNGTLDGVFNPGTGANDNIHSVSIQTDEKIIIAGDFTSYNGTTRNRVARLLNCTPPTITGTTPNNRCGTGTVTLGATASSGTLSWYAASTGGSALGTGTSFITPSISTTTTYYVEASNGGCTSSRTAVIATINTIPTITGTTPNNRCGTGTVTLGATSSSGTLSWYAASTGGSALGTGTSFVTPSISTTTTYYVEASNGGCTSSRTAVIATINAIPTITGTTPNNRCGTGTVTLGATSSSGTLSWYAASTGGSALGTGTSFVTPSISTTTTYYVEASNGGCTSSRTAVIATINAIPTITGTTPNNRCGTGTVTLGATSSSGTLSWYAASTGGSALGTGTSFVTPSISTTTTYYVEASNGGCTSSRTAVLATVNTSPTATVNQTGNTLTALETGMTYQWVDCNNSNAPISGQINQNFNVTINGNYAVVVSNGSCQTTSSCTNVIVTGINNNSVKSYFNVYPNPVNNGQINISSDDQLINLLMYDALGKIVLSNENLNSKSTIVQVTDLQKGIYFLQVKSTKNQIIQKVIIQ
ncbi:MAG: T9SS type A sorting domain-containing protein [Flavobacteriales bacterium]|nr:T9SS type A sorting domain-containing protein [Flavobacteriales bacterium]